MGSCGSSQVASRGSLIMRIMGLFFLFLLLVSSSATPPHLHRVVRGTEEYLEIELLLIQAFKCKIGNLLRLEAVSGSCDEAYLRRVAAIDSPTDQNLIYKWLGRG